MCLRLRIPNLMNNRQEFKPLNNNNWFQEITYSPLFTLSTVRGVLICMNLLEFTFIFQVNKFIIDTAVVCFAMHIKLCDTYIYVPPP